VVVFGVVVCIFLVFPPKKCKDTKHPQLYFTGPAITMQSPTSLPLKRLLQRRDAMHLCVGSCVQNRRCDTGHGYNSILERGTSLSFNEFASLISALDDDMGGTDGQKANKIGKDEEKEMLGTISRKRPRSEMSNNSHSILHFIEREMSKKFSSHPRKNTLFIENELKSFFGPQAEEQIFCSVFSITLNAIIHSLQRHIPTENISFNPKNIPAMPNDPVVNTALRIIDFIVSASKQERAARIPSKHTKKTDTNHVLNKRQRYQHLLQDEQTRNNKKEQEQRSMLTKTKSIIEEKFADKWVWLQCFRQEYNNKFRIQSTVSEDQTFNHHDEQSMDNYQFVIHRRIFETIDDLSLSSHESDEEIEENESTPCGKKPSVPVEKVIETTGDDIIVMKDHNENNNKNTTRIDTPKPASSSNNQVDTPSPLEKLDKETHELRKSLIGMSPSDLSSPQVVSHVTDSLVDLLRQYGDLDGAAGIERCGDVISGVRVVEVGEPEAASNPEKVETKFHINDTLVSSVVKAFLTDAMGALRAKSFLISFVLPLMLDMNGNDATTQGPSNKGKPASRLLTSLVTSLARDRPMECVEAVLIPTLVTETCNSPFHANRFQCELISRLLRGKDSLSTPSIALFIEKILPSTNSPTNQGMTWTENSMPLISACLNRQPPLPDSVVLSLANQVEHYLSPAASQHMENSMKLSTIFHVLVSKYGQQVKAVGKTDSLKEVSSRLKTFMSKTITKVLSKL
jgi:hypothetical protein